MKFKAIFENMMSDNSFTIEELASYEEIEWSFKNGEVTLPSNDIDPGDVQYSLFTGITDKYGEEIYEGHTVKSVTNVLSTESIHPDYYYDKEITSEVKFEQGFFVCDGTLLCNLDNSEIIGNKFH